MRDRCHLEDVCVVATSTIKSPQTFDKTLIEKTSISSTRFMHSDIAFVPWSCVCIGYNFSQGSIAWLLYKQSLMEPSLKIQHALTLDGDKRLYNSCYIVLVDGVPTSMEDILGLPHIKCIVLNIYYIYLFF